MHFLYIAVKNRHYKKEELRKWGVPSLYTFKFTDDTIEEDVLYAHYCYKDIVGFCGC